VYYARIDHLFRSYGEAEPRSCNLEKLLIKEHTDTLMTSISDLAVLYQFQGHYGKPCIKRVCISSRILMKNAVCRRSGHPMSWWEGEEERGEGLLS
jgi:hypothetical protein